LRTTRLPRGRLEPAGQAPGSAKGMRRIGRGGALYGKSIALLVALMASGLLYAQSNAGAGAQSLTLQEAVRIALKKNPAIHAADAYSDAVERGIAVAKSGRLPSVGFSEGFTRGNNPVYVFGTLLTQRQFQAGNFALGFLNYPLPVDNFRTQFSAGMPLFDAGRTSRRVKTAKLDSESAQQSLHRTSQEVIFDVIQAYSNLLLSRESVQVAEAAVSMTTADLARAQAREGQGLAVASDVLSAQVQLAQAKEDQIRARSAEALAEAALDQAMGLPESTAVQARGMLAEPTIQTEALPDLISKALATRPDYQRAGNESRKAEIGTHSARAAYLPTVSLFASWEEDNQTFAARGGNNWTAGATLNFDIFDGGARRALLGAAHAQERRAEAERVRLASGIELEVREAYLNLDAARQRVQVSRDAVSQAKESLRILRNRYEAGLTTITDLLRAETASTQARRNFLNAVFDDRLAFAALELATGELGPEAPAVTK
jgi:outer membrane protein